MEAKANQDAIQITQYLRMAFVQEKCALSGSDHESQIFAMVADIHTKAFTDSKEWEHAQRLACILQPDTWHDRLREHNAHFGMEKLQPIAEEEE